jgi:hypothetical protein
MASIIALKDCLFAVLNKKKFNEILKDDMKIKLEQKIEFISTLPIFKNFSTN